MKPRQYYASSKRTGDLVIGDIIHLNGKCYIYTGDSNLAFNESHLHEINERYANTISDSKCESGQ